MPDLNFRVEGAEPERYAAAPLLQFKLHVTEAVVPGLEPTPIHTVVLRCQVRIEPGRRRYTPPEQERLLDLFDRPERWGQTVRSLVWTQINATVPPFTGACDVDLAVPCSYDFSAAATKYFAALAEGDIPLRFLFSGTIFYQSPQGALLVSQISWEKEATYHLPAATWRDLMELYHPGSAWLCLRKDVFDGLEQYRRTHGLPTADQAVLRLLSRAKESVSP
jgi:hypothetical protein